MQAARMMRLGMEILLLVAVWLFLVFAGGIFLLTGCAVQKKVAAKVVLERPCLTKIELGPNARCTGPDASGLSCTGLVMTVKSNCETLEVVKSKEKKP